MTGSIQKEIGKNRGAIREAFHFPKNNDIVFRELDFCGREAFIVFIDGMVGGDKISDYILRPLLNADNSARELKNILQIGAAKEESDIDQAIAGILQGDTVLFVDGKDKAFICETKGFDKRGVEKPIVENSILGSQESFTENIRTNTALIRRIIKSQSLVTEMVTVGRINNLKCGVMYLEDVAKDDIVSEVKRRLGCIDADFLQNGDMLGQFLEDRSFSLFQTIATTERCDNAAALLLQGRVAIVVDGSPRVIIAPVTLTSILKTSEEVALRLPYASAVRAVRILAVLTALLLPSLYLAATTFHPEMLPASLVVSIARSRQSIPYPAMLELLLMEIAFEMIREAGERIPGAIGGTVSIVGGLILGEAAISAGLVSQSCVIIIALTALCNFAIPQYQTAFAARLTRVIMLAAAGFFGFLGVGAAFVLLVGYLNSLTSLGVDFVNPVFSGGAPMFPRRPAFTVRKKRQIHSESGTPS